MKSRGNELKLVAQAKVDDSNEIRSLLDTMEKHG